MVDQSHKKGKHPQWKNHKFSNMKSSGEKAFISYCSILQLLAIKHISPVNDEKYKFCISG